MSRILSAAFLSLLFAGCSLQGIYYYPRKTLYVDPHDVGLQYDLIPFDSLNGKKLYGIYFRTPQPRKGVVIHFHGNYGNVSNHFSQSAFLLRYGFDVFDFDYQGFGGSEGKPTPKHTVEDGQAALRYVEAHSSGAPVGLFGQSIGAAVACVVAAREPGVRAVVLEAPFESYRAIVRDVMRRSWLLYPLSYFVPALIWQKKFDPMNSIARISPRPVLVIHGTKDRTIPFRMGEKLYAQAREPKKFLKVEGADHLACRQVMGEGYEKEVSDFFADAFEPAARDKDTTQKDTPARTPPPRK